MCPSALYVVQAACPLVYQHVHALVPHVRSCSVAMSQGTCINVNRLSCAQVRVVTAPSSAVLFQAVTGAHLICAVSFCGILCRGDG